MSDPTWEPAPTLAGDPHDDDASVIDDLVTSNPIPPDPAATRETVVLVSDRPKRTTRLMTGYQVLDSNTAGTAFQLLPADPNRKGLSLSVGGTGVADYVLFADEAAKLSYQSTSGQASRCYTAKQVQGIDGHTGPVHVMAPAGLSAPVVVSWSAVSE